MNTLQVLFKDPALSLLIAGILFMMVIYEIDRSTLPRRQQTYAARKSVSEAIPYKPLKSWPYILIGTIILSISLATSRPLTYGSVTSNMILMAVFSSGIIISRSAMNASSSATAVKLAKTSNVFRPAAIVCCVADVAFSQSSDSLTFAAWVFVGLICISLVDDLGTLRYWTESQSWWERFIALIKSKWDRLTTR